MASVSPGDHHRLSFSPDVANLADAAKWPMDPRAWERFACEVAGRDLTRAEWSDLLPDRSYQQVCAS